MKKLFIVTGDYSGDLHASFVVKELKNINPNIEIEAIGGKFLEQENIKIFQNHEKMNVAGISFKAVFDHLNLAKRILNHFKTDFKPDIVLLVDYGGFNLRLAKLLKKDGIKTLYYISPQVWASRKNRIHKIKKYISKMMVIFPFEEEIHKIAGVNAEYVGHPLISQIPTPMDKDDFIELNNLDKNKKIIGIFPGSRKMEIHYMLPRFLKAAKIIHKNNPNVQFCISQSSNISNELLNKYFNKILKDTDIKPVIIKNQNHAILANSDILMLKSGTVTLEAALYNTPMVVSYRGPSFLYPVYLMVRHIKQISLPNIISGKEIVKEYVQYKVKPELIAQELLELLENDAKRNEMINNLKQIQKQLGDKIASKEVARIINIEITKED